MKRILGYYKKGVRHEYGYKLYSTIGQSIVGTMTQKAFSEAVGEIVDEIIGTNN